MARDTEIFMSFLRLRKDGGQEVLDTDDMDRIVDQKGDKDRVCPS